MTTTPQDPDTVEPDVVPSTEPVIPTPQPGEDPGTPEPQPEPQLP
jgi:hypothetical protein